MLTPIVFAQQIARHWSAETSWPSGLTFCGPEEAEASNLYACALPRRAHRLSPGASIVVESSAQGVGNDPTTSINLTVRARAITAQTAYELLQDLRDTLFPTGTPFVLVQDPINDINVNMVPGIPEVGELDSFELWRVIEMSPATGIIPVPGSEPGQATEEGEHEQVFTLTASCVPITVNGAGVGPA